MSTWYGGEYRGSPTYLTKAILLKMTLKYIEHLKARYFCNYHDPPFDMKHWMMSTDFLSAVKIDLKYRS